MTPLATRWLKFNLVGAIGIVVQMGAFALLFSGLHVDYMVATALAVETAVLPGRCAHLVMAADLERGSLHEALVAGGFVPSRGHAVIIAEAATAADGQALHVTPGDPLLVERRVILDQHGAPLEATESRYPADRYALEVGFSVEDRAGRASRSRQSRGRGA